MGYLLQTYQRETHHLQLLLAPSELQINDQIVKSPNETIGDQKTCIVYKIETIKEDRYVYDFMREPFGLIVADSLLVYNAYPVD